MARRPTKADIQTRFASEIALRGYDDRYIDRDEEREILQIAVELGMDVPLARATLAVAADEKDYVLESAVVRAVRDALDVAAGVDGRVDEREFNRAVAQGLTAARGRRSERQVRRLAVEAVEEGSRRVKTGWFSNWYAAVRRELGLA